MNGVRRFANATAAGLELDQPAEAKRTVLMTGDRRGTGARRLYHEEQKSTKVGS